MTKLLVAGGKKLKSVEVINLDESNPELICDDLPDLPFPVIGGRGHLFQGKTPMFCGGFDFEENADSCQCHALQKGEWQPIAALNACRRYFARTTLSISNGNSNQEMPLMIAGNSKYEAFSGAEAFDGHVWRQDLVSSLPVRLVQGCVVKINDTTLLVAGGIVDDEILSNRKTFFYNSLEDKWFPGPTLPASKNGPSCGLLNWFNPDSGKQEKVVVVSGGDKSNDTFLLFMQDYDTKQSGWTIGPPVPVPSFVGTMTELHNSVILIGGGQDGHLYRLDSPFGTWVKMNQTLKVPRFGHDSFLIPDELVNCY